MARLQEGFNQIKREYIFPIIEKKVLESQKKDLLNLGIGDVALPLVVPAANAFQQAIEEMKQAPIGYPTSFGDYSLRAAIRQHEYSHVGIDVNDIFISDGINSDLGDLQELFSQDASFAVHDPSYPVPQDVCIMAGRSQNLHTLDCKEEDLFLPLPPDYGIDVVYLCSPNNPSGTAFSKQQLQSWVDWAKKHHSILIFDAAYADFIQDPSIPKTIYEIEGAQEVCIELKSFSKSSGFTGLRCSYSVVPKELSGTIRGVKIPIRQLWAKRMATKSNGVSFPVQKAALSCFTQEGQIATKAQVQHYLNMARQLYNTLSSKGFKTFGAQNAPYVFTKCPEGMTSWEFFDYILDEISMITVPGSGFGKMGEGYIRFSGFITEAVCREACLRIQKLSLPSLEHR